MFGRKLITAGCAGEDGRTFSVCALLLTQSMQTSLPISPGNPLRNVTGLARQISLPGEHAPLRFPSFPALERTAIMGFNSPSTLSVPAATNTAITVFRQATYPVWADQPVQMVYAVDYASITTPTYAGITETVTYPMRPALYSWTSKDRATASPVKGTLVGISGTPSAALGQPISPILGADRGLPGAEFTFVPQNASFGIAVTAITPFDGAFIANITLEWWSSPGESYTTTSTLTVVPNQQGGFTTWGTVLQGQWIRPIAVSFGFSNANTRIINNVVATMVVYTGTASYSINGDSGTVTVTPSTATCHVPLVYPVEFQNSALPWYATRVTAAALLGTNVTQVLNKGGTVLGGRVSPAVQNAWSVSYSYINGLHPAEKAYLPLETGLYTYCPPSTDLVFFGDYTVNSSYVHSAAPLFLLSNDSMYNKIFLNAPVACSMACTCTWHIEFRTSSALFQVGLSGMTLEALHQAQLVLAESGFFFENVEHKQLLGKVVSLAKKYVPEAVSVINPSAGKMLQSIVSRMSAGKKVVPPKNGPSKPPTTTAKASGIVTAKDGKTKKKKGKSKKK